MRGLGTQESPFIIENATDVDNIRYNLSAFYELSCNVDISGYSNWTPIGTSSTPFSGCLDGKGNKISGLTILYNQDYKGLFGYIKATSSKYIKNLGLENVNITGGITGTIYRASLSGYVGAYYTITNCYALGSVRGGYNVGGLIGGTNDTSTTDAITIQDCWVNVNVIGLSTGTAQLGGLIGSCTTYTNVVRCFSLGVVTYASSTFCGGLIGRHTGGSTKITNSFWDKEVSNCTLAGAGGTGKTTSEMKTQSTYTGWDFSNTWLINTNNSGYPHLRVFDGIVLTPTINIQSYTKSKISTITGQDISTVTFQSNQNLQAWEARADGNGQGSGLLVGSGTTVTANSDVSFDVENEELTLGDKQYRINIYGQNESGVWSTYE